MGATYTRQSTYAEGDVIQASDTNDEFDQLLAAFAASTGHTHDGTTGEGGPITTLAGHSITIGLGTAGTDVTLTFDGETSDGVLKWMEDEDYFEFSDDILVASTEKLQFRDTAIYINSSADGQLDLVADTEIQIAATTIDINGAADISGNLAVGGNLTVAGNATVTGTTTFNGGTLTLGDSASDNVVFGADVDSSIIPDDDDTYDLGSSSQQWRNIFIDGTAEIDTLSIDGTAVTSTGIELNVLDGITSTTAELNIVDGNTSATSTTVADADRVVLNDNGTMVQVAVTDLAAYFDDEITAMPNLVTTAATTVGALDSGSITSGFGTIDTGSSTITTTGLITGGSLDIDDVVINGSTIGHTNDTDLITLADGIATVAGEVSVTTLDIGGTNVTSTAAELNLLDGSSAGTIANSKGVIYGSSGEVNATTLQIAGSSITSTAAELNTLDGITAVVGELNALDLGSTAVGTAIASKAVVLDANKDYTGIRNLTLTGDLTVGGDDLTMGTNTSGHLLIADGTNFNPTAVGDLSEISTVANDDVFLAVDASGGGLKKITRSTIVSGLAVSGSGIANVVEDTTPQLGGNLDTNSHNILIDDAHFIGDENGNEQIIFQTTSSAVNQFDITNAATGNAPELSATGGDTNISLKITPKGSGQVLLDGNVGVESGLIDLKNSGSRSQIKFYCESGNAHAQTLQAAPHSEAASNTLTLPSTGGDVNLVSTASTATLTNKTFGDNVSFGDNNITNVGDIALDSISADGTDINVAVSDNSATAFTIKQGSDAYFVVDTGNSSESVSIGTGVSGTAITLGHSTSEVTVADNLTVTGDLTVSGTTTTVNSTTVNLNDHNIVLDSGNSTSAVVNGAGITLEGGSGDDATFTYNTTGPKFELKLGSNHEDLQVDQLIAASLDISGNVDVDGTLEADAITVDGTTLAEFISDTVGAMVSSNTESGITVTYQDADNTIDFTVGTLNQDTTGNAATATALETARTIHGVSFDGTANIDLSEVIQDTVGAMVSSNTESGITVAYQDGDGTLDFTVGTLNQDTTGTAALATQVTISANNSTDETIFPVFVDGATGSQGLETDTGFTYNPNSGTLTISGELDAGSLDISGNADIDGTLEADAITVNGTALNTVIAGVTVTNATNAAHVQVTDNESTNEDNLITFVENATSSSGNVGLEMDGNLTYNPSTGRLTATQLAGTLQTAAQTNITSLGTLTSLTIDDITINGSTISDGGEITVSAQSMFFDAATDIVFDVGGADIELRDDGTTFGSLTNSSGQLVIKSGSTPTTALTFSGANATFAGTVTDADGAVRAIPQSGSAKTSGYTLATGDVGNFIEVGSSGAITIPNSTFSAGDAVSVFNNTSGDVTVTCSITTAYIAGTDEDKSSVTLATRGVCTILFISGTVCVISGNVS